MLLPTIFLTGCALIRTSGDWSSFWPPPTVKLISVDRECVLLVEGRSANSAGVVRRVQVDESDGTAHIEITMGLATGEGGSGSFRALVPLESPWRIHRVTFGPARKEIWRADNFSC